MALSHVSFQLHKGEFAFLTGPSGAGKSTILKLIYMEERPTAGDVWVSGVSAREARPRDVSMVRRHLGIVFQDFRLLEDRTAEANVAFALEVTGTPKDAIHPRVARALTQVGLASKGTCVSARALGRRAAARRDRARARERSVRAHRRRADRQSRRAGDARRVSAPSRHQLGGDRGAHGDARSRSGAARGIPHDRAEPRPDRVRQQRGAAGNRAAGAAIAETGAGSTRTTSRTVHQHEEMDS